MIFRSIVLLCALALPMTGAVINEKPESKHERREAPFETYGPPPVQQQTVILSPQPVYGPPAVSKYPPPPPERPPPPPQEYGVPVLQYGPPKVQIEYGVPPAQSVQQIQTGNHHHHQIINHGSNSLSFFEQLKQTLGFGSAPSQTYGPPHQPHSSYGPPPQQINHYIPPKIHTKYGIPPKQHFISKPPAVYGPPPSKPHNVYGPPKVQFSAPKPVYSPPIKPAVNFRPQQSYGPPPPPPQQSYGPPPQQSYGPPPQPNFGVLPQQQYGPPPTPVRQPLPAYGPPQQSLPQIQKPIHGAGCDGWKPIPGPSFGTQQLIANSNAAAAAQVQSIVPETSYLPPSDALPIGDANLQVQPLPANLQLPSAGPSPTFNHGDDFGANIGASLSSGFGLTNINVVKSEGIELHNNHLDTYTAPPADSFAPDFNHKPIGGLTPPGSFPYNGPTFKQYPRVNAPRHPIAFRPPVPQGLLESIGQSVQHQDNFGVKLQQQQSVYLPPPTNEVPPPPPGLESLPLAPAAPFHQQQPKANFDQFVYAPSQCSHGPNLAGGAGNLQLQSFSQYQTLQSIPQLQTVYGVPPQPLDVSQSSSFEIAQSAGAQGLLTSYGPPASGSASNIDSLIHTHEDTGPSSSYGPPPSGNPNDNYAHSSQKSLHTVQIDSLSNNINNNEATNGTESNQSTASTSSAVSDSSNLGLDDLPGLTSSGLNIISAQKSLPLEIPVQGQHGTYSLQFQSADPLASQNNEIDTPDHQKLLSEGLLQSILSAIEQPKGNDIDVQAPPKQHLEDHPEVNEFVNSPVGQETLSEVKAE